jgi:hypothetical protein
MARFHACSSVVGVAGIRTNKIEARSHLPVSSDSDSTRGPERHPVAVASARKPYSGVFRPTHGGYNLSARRRFFSHGLVGEPHGPTYGQQPVNGTLKRSSAHPMSGITPGPLKISGPRTPRRMIFLARMQYGGSKDLVCKKRDKEGRLWLTVVMQIIIHGPDPQTVESAG